MGIEGEEQNGAKSASDVQAGAAGAVERKNCSCRGSGMTVLAWCQENGISEKTYYYWQRWLFQELTNAQSQSSGFVEVTPRKTESSGQLTVRIRIADAEAEVYNGADAATLEAVLRALRSC